MHPPYSGDLAGSGLVGESMTQHPPKSVYLGGGGCCCWWEGWCYLAPRWAARSVVGWIEPGLHLGSGSALQLSWRPRMSRGRRQGIGFAVTASKRGAARRSRSVRAGLSPSGNVASAARRFAGIIRWVVIVGAAVSASRVRGWLSSLRRRQRTRTFSSGSLRFKTRTSVWSEPAFTCSALAPRAMGDVARTEGPPSSGYARRST